MLRHVWSVLCNQVFVDSETNDVALTVVEGLESDGRLDRYQYLPAIKAYLLDQLGRMEEAERERTRALELAGNEVERDFLLKQRG